MWSLSCACVLLAGCSALDCCLVARSDGVTETSYLVIGVGLVHVPKVDAGVAAARMTAFGLSASSNPSFRATAGYAATDDIVVARGVSGLFEVGSCPTGLALTTKSIPQQENNE